MANFKRRSRALWLCAAAACAPLAPAFGADLAANDAGSRVIADFIAAYGGKSALPSVKVVQDGSAYLVSFDLGAVTGAMKAPGLTFEPAVISYKVFQQDDGQWRVETAAVPPLLGHMTPQDGKGRKFDMHVETTNFKHVAVVDPKLNWIASSTGGADKINVTERGPGLEEFIELSGVKLDAKTTSGPAGLTMIGSEPIGSVNFVMDVDPKGVDRATGGPAKPVHVSAQGKNGKVDVALVEFQPVPLLDAWRFFAAHPERADLARDFDAMKPVVSALVGDHVKLQEGFNLANVDVLTETGAVAIEGAAVAITAANMGADTGVSEHFSARSIKLPDGLVPPMYAPVVPTAFDFGFKATGFDLEAGVQEYLADVKADPDGLNISDADRAKVSAKIIGSRPILIEIPPSHFTAPSLDISFEGKASVETTQRTGEITITARNFDKTEQAIQGLGQKAAQQLVPVVAMAKGLGKAAADGAMVWVCSIGADHVIKVNGLPLGKAPF